MAFVFINIGNTDDDGLGDKIRDAFQTVNDNFDEALNADDVGDGDAQVPTNLNLKLPVSSITANHTLDTNDRNALLRIDTEVNTVITVPADAGFTSGDVIIAQYVGLGGSVEFLPASGVSIEGAGDVIDEQWAVAVLIYVGSNVWTIIGDLV